MNTYEKLSDYADRIAAAAKKIRLHAYRIKLCGEKLQKSLDKWPGECYNTNTETANT